MNLLDNLKANEASALERKKVVILFSGGLDSTYLAYKNLKEGNTVYPIYIELANNENKTIVEKQQIELIINELSKEFNYNIRTLEIVASISVNCGFNSNVNFPQPLIWAISAPFATGRHYDEIQIAYVNGDDAIAYLDDIKNLYEASKPFTHSFTPITFPLIKKHKYNLMDELPEKYHKLITSCENPQLDKYGIRIKNEKRNYRFFEPCCECNPCKKIIAHNYFGSDIIRYKYIGPLYKQRMKEVAILKMINDEINFKQSHHPIYDGIKAKEEYESKE